MLSAPLLLLTLFLMLPPPPSSTLFPYTTLFRSAIGRAIVALYPDPTYTDRLAGNYLSNPVKKLDDYAWNFRLDHNLGDRKSTRLNSSHVEISYAVFCLKKKKQTVLDRCVQRVVT